MRPSWDDYFMGIVDSVKKRSTCLRRQVGAVIVKNNRIISTGYNGAPSGCVHCQDIGCERKNRGIPSGERHELCRGVHAEQNAILQAAYMGTSLAGATLYVSCQPCSICARLAINAGIEKIIFADDYPDELATKLLTEAGIGIVRYKKGNNDDLRSY